MASIKDLKKDINYVLGDIMDAASIWEGANPKADHAESEKVIDDAIETFDVLITKVNERKVEDRSAHLKKVKTELEEKANTLIERVNAL